MKKVSLFLFFLLSVLKADIFTLDAGYGVEQQKIGGYVEGDRSKNYFGVKNVNPDNDPFTGYFGLKNKNHPYFWIQLSNSIPLIPNVKFQYTKYESSGHSNYVAANVKLFGKVRIDTVLTDANTYMSINSYDATMFYTFNPSFFKIDLGLGADYWRGKFKLYDNKNKKYIINYEGSIILPYVYGNFESIPYYNFSLLATCKIAKVGDKHHYDLVGALKYNLKLGIIKPFIKIGYKYKEAYYKEQGYKTKLSYKGAFVEAGFKF